MFLNKNIMALTDNPYLPLYVRDWLTSNKLSLCSANAHGVLINIMCIMHRENEYGKILLKQKFKQSDEQVLNFSLQIAKCCALDLQEIKPGIDELINEKVLNICGDFLVCERMVNDATISLKRSESGFKGGKKTQKNNKKFAKANDKPKYKANAKAKVEANTEIEIENKNEVKIEFKTELEIKIEKFYKFRKEMKKPILESSKESFLKKLNKLSNGKESIAIEILDQSIANGWQGIFDLKQNNNGKQSAHDTKQQSIANFKDKLEGLLEGNTEIK